jgi:hypothetical protein
VILLINMDVVRKLNAISSSHKIARYKKSTATGTLCNHLISCHTESWIAGCKNKGIVPKAKAAKIAMQNCLQNSPSNPVGSAIPRKLYSHVAFVDSLVDFFVADDIVSYSCA